MRHISQDDSSVSCTTFTTPSAKAPRTSASPRAGSQLARTGDHVTNATEVLLLPNGTFVNGPVPGDDQETLRYRQLAIAIRQRIESRLAGRIRNLAVRIADGKIYLEGQCHTYYTKQLAQHAALGILDNEQLENQLMVVAPR